PLRQRIESKSDLDGFMKNQKAALAADLEVLTGSSDNPTICIGAIANIQIAKPEDDDSAKEEYGKYLVTSIEHHIAGNGKYYNTFEAIPSTLDVVPVKNIIVPIAEPQIATVTDNLDPDNMGRIRVQMLWQKESGQKTDWVRVMTSDAGSSDIVSKNRGFTFIPEIGDQVLVCFRYNDADRPFVLGSIFHGKSAAGGGADNDKKTLSSRSGNVIELNDKKGEEKIKVNTNSGHTIELDDKKGAEKITIIDKNKNKIVIDSVADSINITAASSINMDAETINLNAGLINMVALGAITMNAGGALEGAAGGAVTFGAGASASLMSGMDTVILAGKTLSASGGKSAKISSGAGASMELEAKGNATFNSSKKMDISSKESTISGTNKATLSSKQATMEGTSKAVVKGSQVDIS
ncbi:MAG: phage baseplate assembly protein V, partial [Ginsengibacter sp.]